MMTTQQLNQINQFIRNSGIRYYDLELEIADHIAEWMKMDMEQNNFTFNTSFERLPVYFSATELKCIERSKKQYLSRKYYDIFWNEWKAFFTWPKLILQILFITLSILFFSFIKEKNLIGPYLFQVQLLILFGASFSYRFREIYKLTHETNVIQKLLPSDTIARVGIFLRLPMYACFFLASLADVLTGELPLIFYQIVVYSFAIQIPFLWAVYKTEADTRLRLIKEYPDAFEPA